MVMSDTDGEIVCASQVLSPESILRIMLSVSFMHSTKGDFPIAKQVRQIMWKERNMERVNEPTWTQAIESLPPGQNLKHETWKTLDRLRAGVVRTKKNLVKWKKENLCDLCECGSVQDEKHLLKTELIDL